jgi:NADH:ubiquinone reductase (H+-translocating)
MRIVIVGGGFAGLKLARKLNNKAGFEIVLLDRNNYHQFQPLFYQVATSGLDASNISFPLRKVFQNSRNVRIRLAEVLSVDDHLKKLITDIGDFDYDILVLATGADTNFFGNVLLQEHAMPMKSTVEALRIRHDLIHNFEEAVMEKDPAELKKLMTVVIAGGGPTGVELSGAVAQMKTDVLPKDYPDLDFSGMQIILLEGSDRLLGAMSVKSSEQSLKYLQKLGVKVMLNTKVENYDGEVVLLQDGSIIPAKLVIWAAGIRGNVVKGIDPAIVVKGNRIRVDRTNRVEGSVDIYALGDLAYMETPLYPKGHPQVANVAISQADQLADNLRRLEVQKPVELYEYHDKGSMATVGRNLAVVDIPKPRLHFGGFLAWLVWMMLHLLLLLGVNNRIHVFINWVVNYITYDQNLRLIFREFYIHKEKTAPKPELKKNASVNP